MTNLERLKEIINQKQYRTLYFGDGTRLPCDTLTARVVLTAYDALRGFPEAREKMDRMIESSRANFLKVATFSIKAVR